MALKHYIEAIVVEFLSGGLQGQAWLKCKKGACLCLLLHKSPKHIPCICKNYLAILLFLILILITLASSHIF